MQNEGSQVEETLSPLAYCLILPSLHVFPFKKLIRQKKKTFRRKAGCIQS